MKQRIGILLNGTDSRGLRISTFHTLGLNILRRELLTLGYKPGFSIFDGEDSAALLREILRKVGSPEFVEAVRIQISDWKSTLTDPLDALRSDAGDEQLKMTAALAYAEYERHLKAYNAVDFDDLIKVPVCLFRKQPDTLAAWRHQIRYLLVDEYQDTNAAQYELIRLLAGAGRALTVVGDDDQSIYAWRGARPENLAYLQRDFAELKVIKLEQNYRSAANILKAANKLIANNPHTIEKKLWSELGHGERIKVLIATNEEDEAEQVVAHIGQGKFLRRNGYGDYAILYRGNHQSRVVERALRERAIPYQLTGGTSFFDTTEVKDLIAYLRLIVNPDDDSAFLRIVNTPRRDLGPATLEKLAEYAGLRQISLLHACTEMGLAQRLAERARKRLQAFADWMHSMTKLASEQAPAAVTRTIVQDVDYAEWLESLHCDPRNAERRMRIVDEFIAWLDRLATDQSGRDEQLSDVIAKLALMDMLDRQNEDVRGERVQLMTLHAAKGLEFPHVFMIGMEENLLPHRNSIEADTVEEERRLCYVGITRARQTLVLSYARQRKRHGEIEECEPSRFLSELPREELAWEHDNGTDPSLARQAGQTHLMNLRKMLLEGS
jgi:ATP-dependent DNA helicase Rep